jgi:thioredoxin-dependent peroxiredoxin
MLAAVPLVLLLAAPDVPMHLAVGDAAPDFTLSASTGKSVKLSDYLGKRKVVLAFFPKAFTGG